MDNAKTFSSLEPTKPIPTVTMVAKYGKEKITFANLPSESTNIGHLKEMLKEKTGILPKRQKLIGLVKVSSGATKSVGSKGKIVDDDTPLSELKVKNTSKGIVHQFILMGTPEKDIFQDPIERDSRDLPEVVDDFELDFVIGTSDWFEHKAKEENLQKFTESTTVHIMNEPRQNQLPNQSNNNIQTLQPKPLLVLDLDHTLLDFSSSTLRNNSQSSSAIGTNADTVANQLKRPYMDDFLTWMYKYYDLVVWSQTSWRWLEMKLTELGMLTHSGYKFCFVLDKTSMFEIESSSRSGRKVSHHVKPLQIIWSKFPQWGSHNTVHLDDLSRNFALNLGSGLKCSAFYRKKQKKRRQPGDSIERRDTSSSSEEVLPSKDMELLGIGRFLELLATNNEVRDKFDDVDFRYWQDYVSGKRAFSKKS